MLTFLFPQTQDESNEIHIEEINNHHNDGHGSMVNNLSENTTKAASIQNQSSTSEIIDAYLQLKNALTELLEDPGHEIINSRPGEKLHEILLNKYEINYTKDLGDRYVLLDPQVFEKHSVVRPEIIEKYKAMKSAEFSTEYSSDNAEMMTREELKSVLKNYI